MRPTKQPEQQQQGSLAHVACPGCKGHMRLVGRENNAGSKADLLTYQCACGQIFATTTHQ